MNLSLNLIEHLDFELSTQNKEAGLEDLASFEANFYRFFWLRYSIPFEADCIVELAESS